MKKICDNQSMKNKKPNPLFFLKAAILNKFRHQYVAARVLGVREDHLSAILHGRKPMTDILANRMCQALGIDRASFLRLQRGELNFVDGLKK